VKQDEDEDTQGNIQWYLSRQYGNPRLGGEYKHELTNHCRKLTENKEYELN